MLVEQVEARGVRDERVLEAMGKVPRESFTDADDRKRAYEDIPIQIGWGQMPSPGMPFNQIQLFPCEQKLISTADGPRLTWEPVAELAQLREFLAGQQIAVGERLQRGNAEVPTGDPVDGLDVAQAARGFLDVGFEIVFGVAVALVALALFVALGAKETMHRYQLRGRIMRHVRFQESSSMAGGAPAHP